MKLKVTTNIESFSRELKRVEKSIPKAVDEGLKRWAVTAFDRAQLNLSGAGSKYENVGGKYRRRKGRVSGGGYPVPARTGNLKGSQDFIVPGDSKAGITAKSGQAYLVNTAKYAVAVHEGRGPHKGFGPRRFALDAVNDTRSKGRMAISLELRKALLGK